jgi:nitroreductase
MSSDTAAPVQRDAGLAARYGVAAAPVVGPWNATLDVLLSHRSVRGYLPDALPAHTLETLMAAAQSAATSSNLQTWSVIAVTNAATKAICAKVASNQKHIEQCPLFLVFLADLSRNERLAKEEGTTFETIPYLESYLVAAVDAALAAQNAVVAAESLGLSTVYIGALRNDPELIAKTLDLPPGTMGVFGLCVGYAAPSAVSAVKPRLPQAVVVHHETYKIAGEQALRKGYDAMLDGYSRTHEMAHYTWTDRVKNRMGQISAMGGRDHLTAILHRLGFPLK